MSEEIKNYEDLEEKFKKLLTISELFNNRSFCIPDYQRGYSWENEQLEDLCGDIDKLINANHIHYTGTIVLTLKNDIANENNFYIVDGQQRMTSLCIALYSIYKHNPNKYQSIFSKYIKKGKKGNESLILASDDLSTNEFLKDSIYGDIKNSPEIKSQTLLLKAKEYFDKWIKSNPEKIDDFLNIIENQLGFLVYSPENTKEIGIMFEVINNRGKSLSELEKIKNYFIYYSTIFDKQSLRATINQKWSSILKQLSISEITDNDDENSFLRNCYIVFYYASKTKSWNVYKEIKEKFVTFGLTEEEIDSNIESIESFVAFLERASKYYAYLQKGDYFNINFKGLGKKKLAHILKLLRCQHVNASIIPLFISVMDIYQSENDKLVKVLEIIEKLNFRVYILPKITNRADTYQGSLFWTAFLFFNQQSNSDLKIKWDNYSEFTPVSKSYSDPFDKLTELLITFTTRFCNEKKFVQSLTTDRDEYDDYYNWKGLRYLLANYEYNLKKKPEIKIEWDIEKILITQMDAGKNTNNYLSIEHIWASKNRVIDIPEDHIQKRRLGNFVLLGLSDNIKKSNKDIIEKYQTMELLEKIRWMDTKNIEKKDADYHLLQVSSIPAYYTESEKYLKKDLKKSNRTYKYYIDLATHINDLRETDLVNFALKRWAFDDEELDSFMYVDSFKATINKQNENYFMKNQI